MNTYKYFVRENELVAWNLRLAGVIPPHHNDIIQAHVALSIANEEAPSNAAVMYNPKGGTDYDYVGIAQAVWEASRGSLVCMFHQQEDEMFGPTGWYIILEGTN